MFGPVRARKTFEEAIEQIVDAIRAGDLSVGDRLPSERTLASQMEISRPTLREGIKALVDAGVVEVKPGPGGGMFIRSDVVPKTLLETVDMQIGEVAGVLEARRLFEPRVAQLAALYATEEDFEAMQRTIDLQREIVDDWDRFLQLDQQFHLSMARATRNSTVVALMRLLLRRLAHAREMTFGDGDSGHAQRNRDWAIEIHERTLSAIMGGDPGEIGAAMEEHMSFLERVWEERSGRARVRRVPDFLLPHQERTSNAGELPHAVKRPRVRPVR